MDLVNLISDGPISPVESLMPATQVDLQDQPGDVGAVRNGSAEQQRRVKLAKDFESILMTRVLNEMKNTVGNWDEQEDAASEQMQGIFWLHMAQHVGENGGIGLWKEIVQYMNQKDPSTSIDSSLDDRL